MSNRGPSAYQPNTLLLGETGSRTLSLVNSLFISFCLNSLPHEIAIYILLSELSASWNRYLYLSVWTLCLVNSLFISFCLNSLPVNSLFISFCLNSLPRELATYILLSELSAWWTNPTFIIKYRIFIVYVCRHTNLPTDCIKLYIIRKNTQYSKTKFHSVIPTYQQLIRANITKYTHTLTLKDNTLNSQSAR